MGHRMPSGSIPAAAFTPDGKVVAVFGESILIWRPEGQHALKHFNAGKREVVLAVVVGDGRSLLIADSGHLVRLLDLADGHQISQFSLPGGIRARCRARREVVYCH